MASVCGIGADVAAAKWTQNAFSLAYLVKSRDRGLAVWRNGGSISSRNVKRRRGALGWPCFVGGRLDWTGVWPRWGLMDGAWDVNEINQNSMNRGRDRPAIQSPSVLPHSLARPSLTVVRDYQTWPTTVTVRLATSSVFIHSFVHLKSRSLPLYTEHAVTQ